MTESLTTFEVVSDATSIMYLPKLFSFIFLSCFELLAANIKAKK